MITAAQKAELLDRLIRSRIRGLCIPVVRSILNHLNREHGVAFCRFARYATEAAKSERTVQRTVQVAREGGVLGTQYREGAPVLWCPHLLDMEGEEAVRRADLLIGARTQRQRRAFEKLASPPPSSCSSEQADNDGVVPASQPLASNPAPELASNSAPKLAPNSSPLKPPQEKNSSNELSPAPPTPPTLRGASGQGQRWARPATNRARELVEQLARIAGLPPLPQSYEWPEPWRRQAPFIVQQWLDAGWPADLIICIARATMAGKRDGPPNSVRYFDPPIRRALADLEPARKATVAG